MQRTVPLLDDQVPFGAPLAAIQDSASPPLLLFEHERHGATIDLAVYRIDRFGAL